MENRHIPEKRATPWREWFTTSVHIKRTLQVNILVTFATLMIITVMVIVGYTYQQNSQAILRLSRDLIGQVTETIIERTSLHLLPAAAMTEASAHIPAVASLSLVDNDDLEQYGMRVLDLYPQLSGFYVGNEVGEFLFTKRFPDGSIGTQVINRHDDPAIRTWTYRDTAGNIVETEVTSKFTYDPRERPWYQGVRSSGQLHWTDVYIFFTDQKPGVTAATPIYDETGALTSVIGIDIALEELSQFLETQEVGESGVAFIVNDQAEVIAYPGMSLATREGDDFRLANIDDLGIEWVTAAYQHRQETPQDLFDITIDNIRYIAAFTPFPADFGQNWEIGVIVPEDDFVGTIKQTNRVSLIISLLVLTAAILLAIFLSRSISRPIVLLTEDTNRISDLRLDENLEISSPIREVQLLAESITGMKRNLQIFKKYAPAELVRQLIRTGNGGHAGGRQQELTIMFTEIGGMASLSGPTLPAEMMQQLSQYVGELTTIIIDQKGTLESYVGEGLLAFWGAPLPSHHAYYACRAALECREQARQLNQEWRAAGQITFPLQIGIHTGDTLVGNIGSEHHMTYTVVGQNVNLTKYLETLNPLYGSSIVVSEDTYRQVGAQFHFRPLDRIYIQDNYEKCMIYELLGEKGKTAENIIALCEQFAKGYTAYSRQDWTTAIAIFQTLMQQFPFDSAVQTYLGRCLSLQANPPGPDWQPVTTLEFFNQPRIVS